MENQKKIMENNKLLAEFFGGKYKKQTNIPLNDNEIWLPCFGICNFTTIEIGNGKILKFHKDWNWLIEVVKKIFNTCEVTPDKLDYEWNILFKKIHNCFYCPDIEPVYNACAEFVKWYNEQK
jgi:hypothetical protein